MRAQLIKTSIEQELVNWAEFWKACMDVDTDILYVASLHEILEA